jgi:glutathione S-transferase
MLKIYGRRNSINVQKVMWTIGELGLEAERIDAGLQFGVVKEDWFGDLNPNRLVPTMDDGGFILWESNTIVRYLATKHSSGILMPDRLQPRARAEMWMDWLVTTIMPPLGPLFLGLIRTAPEDRDLKAIAHAGQLVEAGMTVLNGHLAGRQHVLGNDFTVVDIALGCAGHRWYALEIERPDLPHLEAWVDRLRQRPAFIDHVMILLT